MKTILGYRSILALAILVLSNTFVSCKKTQVGPAGADGATGATGATGAPGNANVKSVVFTVSNWKADTTCKNYCYKYHTTDLTNTVLESGAVMLYLGDNTGDNKNQWTPMPVTDKSIHFTFNVELSTIQILVSQPDGKMPADPGSERFKLVIIPPAS